MGKEPLIKWHPAFCSATEYDLRGCTGLEFYPEVQLSREPIKMDFLVIVKNTDDELDNQIAKIFRKYNIFEYKSPQDGLNIDDYYKTVAYACLYKAQGKHVNERPAESITVSLMRHAYPRELIKRLEAAGNTVTEAYPGIYYIVGNVIFPTQIIVGAQLDEKLHRVFKILTNNVKESDAKAFLGEAAELKSNLIDSNIANIISSVLQVSMTSNKELYSQIRGEATMCDAFFELFKDEIAERERLAAEKAVEAANERADANAARADANAAEAKANAARADANAAVAKANAERAEKAETEIRHLKEIIKQLTGKVAVL